MTAKIVSVAALLLALASTQASAADRCGRACLEGIVNRYLIAMVAHDPAQLPLTVDAKFTENGQELRFGDGLWGTISANGRYRLMVADPDSGQIGYFGTVLENGTPVLISLRLKIEYGNIAEAETVVARTGLGPGPTAGVTMDAKTPRAQFTQTVPVSQRMARADLIAIGNSYFTGLANSDGRNAAPFAKSCERLENGTLTTNNPGFRPEAARSGVNIFAMGCEAQQKSGFFAFVTSIRNRRIPIVDRERGLVMAWGFFEHAGRIRKLKLTSGQTVPSPVLAPTTLYISELFAIRQGKIDQVEAVLAYVPYGMKAAIWDEGRSSAEHPEDPVR